MHFNGFIASSVCVDKWHTGEVSKLPGKRKLLAMLCILYIQVFETSSTNNGSSQDFATTIRFHRGMLCGGSNPYFYLRLFFFFVFFFCAKWVKPDVLWPNVWQWTLIKTLPHFVFPIQIMRRSFGELASCIVQQIISEFPLSLFQRGSWRGGGS